MTCDIVFCRRNDCKWCEGPGKVIGDDSSDKPIKYGAYYVQVYGHQGLPNNLVPEDKTESDKSDSEEKKL